MGAQERVAWSDWGENSARVTLVGRFCSVIQKVEFERLEQPRARWRTI